MAEVLAHNFPLHQNDHRITAYLAIKGAASVFEIAYIITGGKMGTSTFVIKTIETGFQYQKIGLASAMAIVLLFIIIVITMIQKIFFKEEK